MIKFALSASLLLLAASASGQTLDVKILNLTNPAQSNGIQVGDVLNRTVEIEVDSQYQLSKAALPLKGENRDGIELSDLTFKSTQHDKKSIYTIALRYQVFASAAKPVVMQLPEEQFTFTGGTQALSVNVPVWHFWFSPLVAEGITNAKDNLQPQYKPALIDLSAHYTRLLLSLALLATGLLGLIYVNADKRWLPFMNGDFAQAHRSIKKLRSDQASTRQALMYMHQAFNQIYGANLFANELDQFLVVNPKFLKLKEDIRIFFAQSNAALFAGHTQTSHQKSSEQYMGELITLSKRLRDCERGV